MNIVMLDVRPLAETLQGFSKTWETGASTQSRISPNAKLRQAAQRYSHKEQL